MPSQHYSSPMHWQTYTTNLPVTPQLEEAFRRQASAAFASSPQSIGYSVSSSFTSHNGVTTGSTQLQVGKSTPWTQAETVAVERYLVGLFPKGGLVGPNGTVGAIEYPSIAPPPSEGTAANLSAAAGRSIRLGHAASRGATSIPSTVSEAGTVPPSHFPAAQVQVQVQQGAHHGQGRFKTLTKRLTKKTTTG